MEASSAHNLVAVSRSAGSLDELKQRFGNRLQIVQGSLTSAEVSEKAISVALAQFGAINSVVANAGVLAPVAKVENADVGAWKDLFDINFFSVVQLVQKAMPHLAKTSGNVVAVLSGASVGNYQGWGAYGASKASLDHFIATVAVENSAVRAISIAPGVVATDMQREIRDVHSHAMLAEAVKKFKSLFEQNNLIAPEVPARVYVNLAVHGWSEDVNGKYFRFDNACLRDYSK